MIEAGSAWVDITPPPGLKMSGFAARTKVATGVHDRLGVRALAIGDTAIAVADVLGCDAKMSARVRDRCVLPAQRVIVTGLHNHGGPCVLTRMADGLDPTYMGKLEDGLVAAIDQAVAHQQPATLGMGMGADPDVARNRRHPGGRVDPSLPVLRVRDTAGRVIAVLVCYACHPVVLGADNLLWTADYPHFVRTTIEAAYPGALAIFLTGCAGDANNGHDAHASQSLAPTSDRSFAEAKALGQRIGAAALAAPETPAGDTVAVGEDRVELGFERRETRPLSELAALWRSQSAQQPDQRALLAYWTRWADDWAGTDVFPPWTGRVSAFDWGGVRLAALPGEIFAATGLAIREALAPAPAFVFSYADALPGYIPPRDEYRFGGYELDEAHRYLGMPASFAPGSAERLAAAAIKLNQQFTRTSATRA